MDMKLRGKIYSMQSKKQTRKTVRQAILIYRAGERLMKYTCCETRIKNQCTHQTGCTHDLGHL